MRNEESLTSSSLPFLHDDPEAQRLIELYVHTDLDQPDPTEDEWNAQP